jgi:hypothetical protein
MAEEKKEGKQTPDMIEQKFGLFVVKHIDTKNKKMQVELKTKSEGIPLSEAVIILEGWVKKVKEELQRPFVQNLKFG